MAGVVRRGVTRGGRTKEEFHPAHRRVSLVGPGVTAGNMEALSEVCGYISHADESLAGVK